MLPAATVAAVAAVPPAAASAVEALPLIGPAAVLAGVPPAAALQGSLGEGRVETLGQILLVDAEALGALRALLGVLVLFDAETLGPVGALLGFGLRLGGGEAEGVVGRGSSSLRLLLLLLFSGSSRLGIGLGLLGAYFGVR